MRLTYIFHSGFVLEAGKSILIFDYWMDPRNVMESVLQSEKPLYVFSSHFHEDHFTREIFEWRKKKENITYILSKDILRHRRAGKEEADAWLAKGASWADELVSVKASGSTDSGVSWIIETEGRRIFHAGDLNNWYARFLPEAMPGQTVYSKEFDEDIDPIAHEKQYLGELKDIRKVTDTFDLVMFPIDGRIGNGYTLGGRQFIERFKVGMFVPMHFVASGFESSWRMKEFTDEKNISFWEITGEGETIEIRPAWTKKIE
jgi:L-ascorbate metabolism protein UlaG (beta-lactamase superfamily)